MIVAFSAGIVVGLVGAVLVMAVFILLLQQMVNIVQQGEVGVVKHLGEYRKTHEPGLVIIAPFVDSLQRVDMREIPRPGDRQDVITKDNVVVTVNATIFTQIVVAEQALFSIANFDIGIDALARQDRQRDHEALRRHARQRPRGLARIRGSLSNSRSISASSERRWPTWQMRSRSRCARPRPATRPSSAGTRAAAHPHHQHRQRANGLNHDSTVRLALLNKGPQLGITLVSLAAASPRIAKDVV